MRVMCARAVILRAPNGSSVLRVFKSGRTICRFFNMDTTEKFVMWRLAEGDEPEAIVRALKEQDERVEAVLSAYVSRLVEQAEEEPERHHSFRLSRH